jgi:hypothetical protein
MNAVIHILNQGVKNMKNVILVLILAVVILFMSSCTYYFRTQDGNLGYYPGATGVPVGSFQAVREQWYVLSPLWFPFSEPNKKLDEMIVPEMVKYNGSFVKDLNIGYGFTFVDYLITYITGGLLGRNTITVDGQIYRNF